jgi:hypothetical protein
MNDDARDDDADNIIGDDNSVRSATTIIIIIIQSLLPQRGSAARTRLSVFCRALSDARAVCRPAPCWRRWTRAVGGAGFRSEPTGVAIGSSGKFPRRQNDRKNIIGGVE